MVRLKAEIAGLLAGYVTRFNSTMVRLKVVNVHGLPCLPFLFQFHYGTIKSGHPRTGISAAVVRFNSTMVRLKDNGYWQLSDKIDGFNSTMVRLKALSASSQRSGFLVSIPLWYD